MKTLFKFILTAVVAMTVMSTCDSNPLGFDAFDMPSLQSQIDKIMVNEDGSIMIDENGNLVIEEGYELTEEDVAAINAALEDFNKSVEKDGALGTVQKIYEAYDNGEIEDGLFKDFLTGYSNYVDQINTYTAVLEEAGVPGNYIYLNIRGNQD